MPRNRSVFTYSVIVEYMSSPYLRSAVGVVLDCFHMPGRGQGSWWWRKRAAGLSFLPARLVCEREGCTRFRRTSISHGRWTGVRVRHLAAKEYLPDLSGLRRAHYSLLRRLVGILCAVAASNGNDYPEVDQRVHGKN